MEKLLSIIIPSYNMEQYLPVALGKMLDVGESQIRSLDILVVNDGSKDQTSAIAHEYEKRFSGVVRVVDKTNGHYGSCVNAGLARAVGKYIRVIDADDYVDSEQWPRFLKWLSERDDDLLINDFENVDAEGRVLHQTCYDFEDTQSAWRNLLQTDIDLHAITYKRALFDRLKYHQSEGIAYTDTEWRLVPLLAVSTIGHFEGFVVKYLVGRDGQSMDPKRLAASYEQMAATTLASLRQVKDNLKLCSGLKLPDVLKELILRQIDEIYLHACFGVHGNPICCDINKFDQSLKEEHAEFYRLTAKRPVIRRLLGLPVPMIVRRMSCLQGIVFELLRQIQVKAVC